MVHRRVSYFQLLMGKSSLAGVGEAALWGGASTFWASASAMVAGVPAGEGIPAVSSAVAKTEEGLRRAVLPECAFFFFLGVTFFFAVSRLCGGSAASRDAGRASQDGGVVKLLGRKVWWATRRRLRYLTLPGHLEWDQPQDKKSRVRIGVARAKRGEAARKRSFLDVVDRTHGSMCLQGGRANVWCLVFAGRGAMWCRRRVLFLASYQYAKPAAGIWSQVGAMA